MTYIFRVPRKLRNMRTERIELCGQRALQWLKEGMSPVEPHDFIASFGTQPKRAWNIKPNTDGGSIDVSDSDDTDDRAERDAAEQREVASSLIGQLLARIDNATRGTGQEEDSSQDDGDLGTGGRLWPGVKDRTRTRMATRAH